jgi:UDP-galactose transporter B1
VRTKELNPMAAGPKRPSMHESMLWTNASGFLVALLLALASGHLFGGVAFCARHPAVLYAIVIYALSSALGGNFVYFTLTQFNPLVLTTVTTTRKIFSTLYSIFRNPANSLNPMQWSGTLLVFAGLLADIVRKLTAGKPKPKPAPAPAAEEAPAPAAS